MPYIPGYVVAKMLIAAFGLVLIGLSMIKLGPVLVHLLTGERAQAEAVRVVRVSAGGQEEVLTSNRAIEAYTKDEKLRKDRGYVYWNEFRYTTREGAEVEFRFPVGQFLTPHYMILDKDGVPSSLPIRYAASDLQHPTLYTEWFTWFLPGSLLVFGALTTWVGLTLLYYARKPIEMPDLRRAHLEKPTERFRAPHGH
ncbi:MAG TPA: hypothetical protein DCS97_11290 [Planctomycetes bacterium]|nr:hypothetical protein [Planctomycetota bacterium]